MGLGASQARLVGLTGSLTAVQRQGQMINEQRTAIASELNKMANGQRSQVATANPFSTGGNTSGYVSNGKQGNKNPNKSTNTNKQEQSSNPFGSLLSNMEESVQNYPGAENSSLNLDTGKLAMLQAQDARLEMLLKVLDMQEQAMKTEIDAVKKVISKNVESSFKMMA
jgi:hypothetical protein